MTTGHAGGDSAAPRRRRRTAESAPAETALPDGERRFRELADAAPMPIWISAPDGSLEFANREFAECTGLSQESMPGRRWAELLHREDVEPVSRKLDGAAAGALPRAVVTAQVRTRNGQYRWMKLCATARPDPNGRPAGLVGSMADIDGQIGAERALRAADQRKDEFLAMLGHELRNPLVPIRNAAEVLDRVAGDDSRLQWVRDTLVRQVEHVTRLVDDLLNISRITRGALRLALEPVELQRAVQRAVESSMPLIQRKHHRFDCRLSPDPLCVEGDAIRLAQVFENLLTNAAKYTDEGGTIELELRRSGDQAVVSVRDNGLGIAPGMGDRIFDLFVQDERSVDRSQGGLGIGLSLVRHLVELHRGSVDVHSEGIGKGCEFVVRLPLLTAAVGPDPARHSAAGDCDAAQAQDGGRILVVDDDVDSAETTTVLLQMEGHQVEAAADLPSALRAAARLRPQVVLLDLALPHHDGYEVARQLRALPELPDTVKFVAVSGFGRAEDFERTARAGFERLMVKPVDPEELARLLRTLLGR